MQKDSNPMENAGSDGCEQSLQQGPNEAD